MPDDDDLIRRCLRELGLAGVRPNRYRRLAGADSGAQVFRLTLAGRGDVVLKVTTRRELAFYRDLAGRVPIRTPALLGAADGEPLTCLLLEAVKPSSPAAEWTHDRWVAIAEQLGRLHQPDVRDKVRDVDWLGRDGWPPPDHVATAAAETRERWRALGHGGLADPLFDRLDELDAALAALPECPLHGDCHAANLLLGPDDELCWTDWQVTTIGRGPEDFALLWSRANADGARPPYEAMLATYAVVRGLPDDDRLRRAMVAGSIRLALFGWPERLPGFDAERRGRIVAELEGLARRWLR